MKRKILYLCLILVIFISSGPPNCNIYKEDEACYKACLEAEKAIRHGQGSKASQIHFDKSIESCPTFDYSYYEKSVPYLKRGKFIEWKKLMDKAVELNPESYLGLRGWDRYQFLRDYQGAIDDIERLEGMVSYDVGYSVNGNYHLKIAKAFCYKSLGKKEKALEIMENHLADTEYSAGPYDNLHLGVLYLENNQALKAIEAFKKEVALNDYLAETYYYWGMAERAMANFPLYKELMEKALKYYDQGKFYYDPYTHPIDKVFRETIAQELEKAYSIK